MKAVTKEKMEKKQLRKPRYERENSKKKYSTMHRATIK